MTEFSSKLQQLRESKGWSKTKLANHIGVSLSTYANWEYGIAEPDIETIKRICTALDVSADVLLNLTQHEDKETINNTDLDKMLDNARSFDGKPMDQHDRELIHSYLKGLYDAK